MTCVSGIVSLRLTSSALAGGLMHKIADFGQTLPRRAKKMHIHWFILLISKTCVITLYIVIFRHTFHKKM